MSSTPSFSAADRSQSVEGEVSPPPAGGEIWPDTDHRTLTTLRNGSAAEKEDALRRFFIAYLPPLRQYIHHHWPLLRENDIDDLVAEFITLCLTGDNAHFLTYEPEHAGSPARLRTYLRAILDNFLRNHRRNTRAQIRGGNRHFESLNTIRPAPHQETPADGSDPSPGVDIEAYDRHWAQHIINVSFRSLENSTPANHEWLPILRPWILAEPGNTSLKEIARDKGCTHEAVRAQLHRLRKAWRRAVRHAVAQTVSRPEEIDDELRHLAAVLARHPVE